jgi:hypothetical protein
MHGVPFRQPLLRFALAGKHATQAADRALVGPGIFQCDGAAHPNFTSLADFTRIRVAFCEARTSECMRCQEVRQMPDCRVAAETTLHTTVTGCNKQIADRRLVLLERQVNGACVNAFISHFLSLTLE